MFTYAGESNKEAIFVHNYSKTAQAARPCPKCGSSLGRRRHRCLFCGDQWQVLSAFEFLEMEAPEEPPPPTATTAKAAARPSEQIRAGRRPRG